MRSRQDFLSEENLLNSRNFLIQKPGIYFLFKEDKIVYIGQSLSVEQRVASHSDKNFDSYSVIPCNENGLDSLEAKYILKYLPKYNKRLPPFARSRSGLSLIGKLTPPSNNKKIELNGIIIGDKLYLYLSKMGIKLL